MDGITFWTNELKQQASRRQPETILRTKSRQHWVISEKETEAIIGVIFKSTRFMIGFICYELGSNTYWIKAPNGLWCSVDWENIIAHPQMHRYQRSDTGSEADSVWFIV